MALTINPLGAPFDIKGGGSTPAPSDLVSYTQFGGF